MTLMVPTNTSRIAAKTTRPAPLISYLLVVGRRVPAALIALWQSLSMAQSQRPWARGHHAKQVQSDSRADQAAGCHARRRCIYVAGTPAPAKAGSYDRQR